MTETEKLEPELDPELELDIEPSEETATIEPTPEKPKLNVEEIRDLMVLAKGGDPKATQTLNDFIKFENNTERSNFPNTKTVLVVAQLNGYSKLFYPDEENPFGLVAECLEIAFMAKKGWKSNQFVEMTKQTPSIPDLVTIGEGQRRGFRERFLGGRGKE